MEVKSAAKVIEITSQNVSWRPLVLKAQKGNKKAMKTLLALSETRFYKFCLYLTGNEANASDLYQDSVLRALESLHLLKAPYNFMAWLNMIARNLFLDSKKGGKNKAHFALEDVQTDSLVDLSNPQLSFEIRYALNQLADDERMIILLVDMEGYSYAEASRIANVSEAALRSKLHRARKAFCEAYQKSA